MRHGLKIVWVLALCVFATLGASIWLLRDVLQERFRRDVTRMAFNHNLDLLDDVRRSVGDSRDSLAASQHDEPDTPDDKPYIVVSIEDHRLWYKQGDQVLFTARVATGSGKELVNEGGVHWKFDTPRGRLVVLSKEMDPVWVPPDWHYMEMAKKKKLGTMKLQRGQSILLQGGGKIIVSGNDVVTQYPDGHIEPFEVKEGHEIVANGNLVIPPFGTNQRKYSGTLGVERLYLGDGYGIHGTDEPLSIGTNASHGCVRLRNEDIETLFRVVPIGTVVYIY
ncbi:MAG TPA: L,D-transpeptidase [Gemmatimonadaceae bacterium]|nr:L,D-transpeptidase [Gemmatimonadaceae bacterium]